MTSRLTAAAEALRAHPTAHDPLYQMTAAHLDDLLARSGCALDPCGEDVAFALEVADVLLGRTALVVAA